MQTKELNAKQNKKIGGIERAQLAREELKLIFCDPTNPMYFSKDIDYANKFQVARHTIYAIGREFKIPPRSTRILNALKKMKTEDITLKDLSEKLNIKYQNLYKVVTDNGIKVKKDVPVK